MARNSQKRGFSTFEKIWPNTFTLFAENERTKNLKIEKIWILMAKNGAMNLL